jgi:NAD(P)-dependent dehydrogenase (short-subunit alcohol dehydrogenase family)
MPKKTVLITGASGEIGQALIKSFSKDDHTTLITVDIKPLQDELDEK